jgi:hypothetical protein
MLGPFLEFAPTDVQEAILMQLHPYDAATFAQTVKCLSKLHNDVLHIGNDTLPTN